MAPRPNILFLFSDQHNANVLGCYGNRQVHTPWLDRLAAEGVRCTQAYTQNPICTPSRTCYFSGQYPHNHGFYGLDGPLPRVPSLFTHLRAQGYRTGMAGKIHTPPGWLSQDCDFVRDGYGHEYLTAGHPRRASEGDLQGGMVDDYTPYLAARGLQELRDDKYLQEWAAMHGMRGGQGLDARPSRLGEDDTIEAWTAAQTIAFLEEAQRDARPFCCWMTVPRPHETYVPARKFWDLYDEAALELPPSADDSLDDRHPTLRAMKAGQQDAQPGWTIFEPRDYAAGRRRVLHGYYACVSQVDDAVGRVLTRLEELGLRENTIVIYATDHGDFAGEHGIIEKAPGISSRAITRIPFLWSWPGHLPQGAVCDHLVETVDFLPTVCALAGLPRPGWEDGHDISGLLRGDGTAVRQIAVTENPFTRAVHTDRYTLVHYPPAMTGGEDFGELFDHQDDPWERSNLYFDPAYAPVIEELRRQLLDWFIATSRPVTVHPNPPGRPSWQYDTEAYAGDGTLKRETAARLLDSPHGWMKNYL